jgi:hypothetical protein
MTRHQVPDIELHIEELVVHGAPAGQRDAIAAQLVASLEPALAEHGLGPWAVDGTVIDQLAAPLEPAIAATTTPAGGPIGRALATTLRRPPP